jgi:archaellum component FlaC
MTIKEEVEQLKKEIKQLKKELSEQNNKWNKVLAYASVVSAIASSFSLLIA